MKRFVGYFPAVALFLSGAVLHFQLCLIAAAVLAFLTYVIQEEYYELWKELRADCFRNTHEVTRAKENTDACVKTFAVLSEKLGKSDLAVRGLEKRIVSLEQTQKSVLGLKGMK